MLCEKWQQPVVAGLERQVDCGQGWSPGGVILGQVTRPRCHGKELGSILTWGSPWGTWTEWPTGLDSDIALWWLCLELAVVDLGLWGMSL